MIQQSTHILGYLFLNTFFMLGIVFLILLILGLISFALTNEKTITYKELDGIIEDLKEQEKRITFFIKDSNSKDAFHCGYLRGGIECRERLEYLLKEKNYD